MAELFGFSITRQKKTADPKQSFTQPQADDGTQTIAAGGYFGQYLDMEGTAKTEQDLIRRYREIALHPECDMAIEDIVNEAVVANELKDAIRLKLDEVPFGKEVRRKIEDEFQEILRLMNFNTKGHDIFRRWYVDGRVYYHKVIDRESPRKGITELRYIDPRKIKKIREKITETDPRTRVTVDKGFNEYYIYHPKGITSSGAQNAVKIAKDSICHVTSGMNDPSNKIVLGHLNKAIKPLNQLRMLEDATVIYRLSRAPERRIFYIDVGNLPKVKAEAYLKDVMNRYRNKLVYDARTGEIRDDRNHMSMLEDFWLPRREGGRGTEITTLPGGSNLGEIDDITYFQKKLFRSLNVPVSRLAEETGFQLGRSDNITRDELKFTKFVQRLRKKFSNMFLDMLKSQLLLKGVIALEEWNHFKEHIQFDFLADGHFTELKNAEILRDRLDMLGQVESYVGTYFSKEYVKKQILRMSDEEIEEIDNQLKDEEGGDMAGDDDGMFAHNDPNKGDK